MLFNSPFFLFVFLPIVIIGYYLLLKWKFNLPSLVWLVLASLFFYGWWNPLYLILICGSILFNYYVGVELGLKTRKKLNTPLMFFGVGANVALLVYFKYTHFIVNNINQNFGSSYHFDTIILPLAISFFTFQQIAYLVDAYNGKTHEYKLLHYSLFVTFFPQLIAGPIVHHSEMLPQFSEKKNKGILSKDIAVGVTIFAIGLFKKVVLADGIAVYATPVFDAAEAGVALTIFEAWGGAFAYTCQLYFDFSGYSDMAVGLAAMFGIILPLNFRSPFRSHNIIIFWSRWHMTLSRFIQEYIYAPIAMPMVRFSIIRRYGGIAKFTLSVAIPTLVAFFLAGIWHGAGWNFIIFGTLHGIYIVFNHAWRGLRQHYGHNLNDQSAIGLVLGQLLTFFAVVLSFVFFRAETFSGAQNMLIAMVGNHDTYLPNNFYTYFDQYFGLGSILNFAGLEFKGTARFFDLRMLLYIIGLMGIIIFIPNTMQFVGSNWRGHEKYGIADPKGLLKWLTWRPTFAWALIIAFIFTLSLTSLSRVSEFLYFQF